MRKLIVAGLVVLAVACGSEDKQQPPLQYGAPESPTYDEQLAASVAQETLEGSLLTFAPSTEPSFGTPGLADQLVFELGGQTASRTMPDGQTAKLAGSAVSRAIDTGGIDPACVTMTETSVVWNGCSDTMTSTDPYTGDTMTATVTVAGTLTWNAGTGTTAWNIHETMSMTETQDGQPLLAMNTAVDLAGSLTVTASTITGDARSSTQVRGSFMGIPMNEGYETKLALDLGYEDPFCVTSGTLVLEQRWTERPMGATPADLPDQGWRFEWSGCNQLTVAHGS